MSDRHENITSPEVLTAIGDDGGSREIIDGTRRPFNTYPGSKDATGAAEQIIAAMPAHSVYVEPFLEGGAVLRRKIPALASIGIDLDPSVIDAWSRCVPPATELLNADAFLWLEDVAGNLPSDSLIYLDPPYPPHTRTRRRIYRCELNTTDHERLLELIAGMHCGIMISSYANDMYERALSTWHRTAFEVMTRGGATRTEILWTKHAARTVIRDHSTAGADYRQRERIKRKAARWAANLDALPNAEADAILCRLLEHRHARR